jgi:YgiT-type zinc finger domain-containing protein
MKKSKSRDPCSLCGRKKKAGTTTFTADLGIGLVIVRKVPATVCTQCGADWINDRVAKHLEEMVTDARKKRLQVEVASLD